MKRYHVIFIDAADPGRAGLEEIARGFSDAQNIPIEQARALFQKTGSVVYTLSDPAEASRGKAFLESLGALADVTEEEVHEAETASGGPFKPCPFCGAGTGPGAAFCPSCGNSLSGAAGQGAGAYGPSYGPYPGGNAYNGGPFAYRPWPVKDDRIVSMVAHLCGLAGYAFPFADIIIPLIIYLVKGDESPYIKEHAKESLNFQISVLIYTLAGVVLSLVLIGIVLLIALFVFELVVCIMAAVAAYNGTEYRYPLCIRFVK